MRNLLINGAILLDLIAVIGLIYVPVVKSGPIAALAVGFSIVVILIEWERQ